jgi:hypothetical protein
MPRPAIRARKGCHVQTKPRIETGSLVSEVILEPVPVQRDVAAHQGLTATATVTGTTEPALQSRRPNAGSSPFAKLLGVIRGDKYMANAYPPDWHSAATARDGDEVVFEKQDGEAATGARTAVATERTTVGHAASRASRTKER